MKKFLIIAILIAIAAVVINYSLGGFKTIEPSLISTDETFVFGQYYEGSYKSETLSDLVSELRDLLEESGNDGFLTIVNFHQEELEKRGMVKQFVGIIWNAQMPGTGYDSLLVPAYNGAQFVIPVKPLVMPSPEKLNNLATEFALQMESSLQGMSIEQYRDNTLIINFPIN